MNKITQLRKDKNFRRNYKRKEMLILLNKYNIWSNEEKKLNNFFIINF